MMETGYRDKKVGKKAWARMIKSCADCKVINRLCTVAHRTASDVP
jgi:hypothetical protein